jgi:hypothetical protein
MSVLDEYLVDPSVSFLTRTRIQAQVLVPVLRALRAAIGKEKADALVRQALHPRVQSRDPDSRPPRPSKISGWKPPGSCRDLKVSVVAALVFLKEASPTSERSLSKPLFGVTPFIVAES